MSQSSNLGKVIECLQQQEKVGQARPQVQDIEQIHNVTITLLDNFNDQINRCKKYNEARIHRKYENTILLLEEQNITLQRKLDLEREALPSSQAYVSDLIDRMVDLKNTNDRLRKENDLLKEKLIFLETRQEQATKFDCTTAESSELPNESMLIRDAIQRFTRGRKQEGISTHRENGNLLRFFEFNSGKASKWTLNELFQRLDKWMANMKDARFLDSQRLRQNLERTCSSIEAIHPPPIGQTTRGNEDSRLTKLKTENIGSFVNERFTLLSRRQPGKALHASLVRREIASHSQKSKAGRR